MANLITVPSFIFEQGEMGDDNYESPIQVQYYNNCIVLVQTGNEILIPYVHLDKLIKSIRKNKAEASENLLRNK